MDQPPGKLSRGLNSPKLVERARDRANRLERDLRIERHVVELGVSEQDPDDTDVGTVLQQVGREAAAQRVRPTRLAMSAARAASTTMRQSCRVLDEAGAVCRFWSDT